MVFTTDGFFEVGIESLPEWDLNRVTFHFGSLPSAVPTFISIEVFCR